MTAIEMEPPAALPTLRLGTLALVRWVPWMVFALTLMIGSSALNHFPVGVFYDDGFYAMLGKALATGQGFRYLNIPGHPAVTHFPPGYPAVLALLWNVAPFPANVPLFKAANVIFLGIAAWVFTRFAIRRLGVHPVLAGATVLLFSTTIPVLTDASVLLSESLFLAVLAPTLWASERTCDEDARPWWAALSALMAVSLTMVRTAGEPLVIAVAIVLVLRRRWRMLAIYLPVAALLLAPWHWWVHTHAGDVPPELSIMYIPINRFLSATVRDGGLSLMGTVMWKNIVGIWDSVRVVFTPDAWGAAGNVLVLPVWVAFLAGFASLARRAPVTLLWLLAYGVVVVAWPFWPYRFMWGIWPLVGVVIAEGIRSAWPLFRPGATAPQPRVLRYAALVCGIGLVACAASNVGYTVRGISEGLITAGQGPPAHRIGLGVLWVNHNTAPEDVIMVQGEAALWLYTGRESIPSTGMRGIEYVQSVPIDAFLPETRYLIAQYKPAWYVVTKASGRAAVLADSLLHAASPELRLVDKLPDGGAVLAPVGRAQ